ncbi:cytochrome P450 [Nemania sp. NC0429]|nr:cytochrome P450 [Nemania sp. NC0429]
MMDLPVSRVLLLGLSTVATPIGLATLGLLAVLLHRLYFIQGEHHMKASIYFLSWISLCAIIYGTAFFAEFQAQAKDRKIFAAGPFMTTTLINCAFFGPLFTSMTIYRIFEHPLRHFPGPPMSAVSKLWHFICVLGKQNHLLLEDLQKEYGPFVRTGPQELTIFHPDVFQAIGGHGTSCIKAPLYELMHPFISINTLRTKQGYAPRRKRWDEALGLSAPYIPDKPERVYHSVYLLLQQMRVWADSPVNVTVWFHHLSWDVMMNIGFGRTPDLTKDLRPDSKLEGITSLLMQGIGMLRFFMPAPWIGRLAIEAAPYVPFITQRWNRALQWAAGMCDGRLDHDEDSNRPPDVFSRLIEAPKGNEEDPLLDREALYGDAYAILIAGSHTTAGTLTMLTYELARRPEIQVEARKEVLKAGVQNLSSRNAPTSEAVRTVSWNKLPFLDGCINEAMRLYPALPTGGARQTIDRAITIGGRYIPPWTTIVAPRWSIGRLEAAYDDPHEFIPERWTTKRHMVKCPQAFSPFADGRHTCPGKQLGMLEVRMVAAMILANFQFSLAPGKENQTRAVDDLKDGFTATPGELSVVFTPIDDHA